MQRFMRTACLAAAFAAAPTVAHAAYLTNTDFEQTPLGAAGATFPGWTESGGGAAASDASTPISGTHSAKLGFVSAGNLFQGVDDVANTLTAYTFAFDAAASDPGSGSSRSLNLNLRHTSTGFNQINMRLTDEDNDGIGDLEFYTNVGPSWTVNKLDDVFVFSADQANLAVNNISIAVDYTTGSYVVSVLDANNVLHVSGPLSNYQGSTPTATSALEVVSFETGNSASGSFAVIDNVSLSIPEPASMALAGVGSLALVARRRRA